MATIRKYCGQADCRRVCVNPRHKALSFTAIVDVPPKDGKRSQARVTRSTKGEAVAALAELRVKVGTGDYVEPSKQTLDEYVDEWLKAMRSSVRPSTWSSYAMNLEVHMKPTLGAVKLQHVTPAMLSTLYGDLLDSGRHDGKGGLSPRSVRYLHTITRKALSDAVRWGRLARNPADLASPPAARMTRAPEMKTWSGPQLRRFLEHVRTDRLYAAWLLLASTGLRRGELLGLGWPDVDMEVGRISVRRALIMVDHDILFSEPKTTKSRRTVSLDATTVAALKDHRRRNLEERLAWGEAYENQDLVFCRENGRPLNPNLFSKAFHRHAVAAELPLIRVHDLRHTHATLALQAGVHPKVVSERLGHSTVALTLDTYSHAVPGMEELAAERIASVVWG